LATAVPKVAADTSPLALSRRPFGFCIAIWCHTPSLVCRYAGVRPKLRPHPL